MAKHFQSRFKGAVGTVYKLKAACAKLGYRRNTQSRDLQRIIFLNYSLTGLYSDKV